MPRYLKRIARIFNNPILSAISNAYFLVTAPGLSAVISAVVGRAVDSEAVSSAGMGDSLDDRMSGDRIHLLQPVGGHYRPHGSRG